MSEAESQFKGIRGFLWLAVGILLLAARGRKRSFPGGEQTIFGKLRE